MNTLAKIEANRRTDDPPPARGRPEKAIVARNAPPHGIFAVRVIAGYSLAACRDRAASIASCLLR
ncbi:MAG: hypothetical protein JWO38_4281 [Gemmataceae bacterium]|nr:hypothetical protein [Gemmataceae bacterium]